MVGLLTGQAVHFRSPITKWSTAVVWTCKLMKRRTWVTKALCPQIPLRACTRFIGVLLYPITAKLTWNLENSGGSATVKTHGLLVAPQGFQLDRMIMRSLRGAQNPCNCGTKQIAYSITCGLKVTLWYLGSPCLATPQITPPPTSWLTHGRNKKNSLRNVLLIFLSSLN